MEFIMETINSRITYLIRVVAFIKGAEKKGQ